MSENSWGTGLYIFLIMKLITVRLSIPYCDPMSKNSWGTGLYIFLIMKLRTVRHSIP
jgi:hypothetical protein